MTRKFGYGLTFETFVDASVSNAVPEPPSLPMLLAGLGIMAGAFGLKHAHEGGDEQAELEFPLTSISGEPLASIESVGR